MNKIFVLLNVFTSIVLLGVSILFFYERSYDLAVITTLALFFDFFGFLLFWVKENKKRFEKFENEYSKLRILVGFEMIDFVLILVSFIFGIHLALVVSFAIFVLNLVVIFMMITKTKDYYV